VDSSQLVSGGPLSKDELCEKKSDKQLNFSLEATTHQDILYGPIQKFSNWSQHLRGVTYAFRFIINAL